MELGDTGAIIVRQRKGETGNARSVMARRTTQPFTSRVSSVFAIAEDNGFFVKAEIDGFERLRRGDSKSATGWWGRRT